MRWFGGSDIGPKPGYWRSHNKTDNFIDCLHPPACRGYDKVKFTDNTGNCSQGYTGKLWADCQVNFSRSGSYQCSKCPNTAINIIRLLLIAIGYIIWLVIMVKSTLSGALNKKDIQSVYIKILVNHLQLISITASFDFRWSPQIIKMFDSVEPISEASSHIFSFDCFLDRRNTDDDTSSMRTYYQKMIIQALLPLILAFASFVFWNVFYCIKRPTVSGQLRSRIVATIIIMFFNVHPGIVTYMFSNFK